MKQTGFTIIECIIYLGLFGVLMSGLLVTSYALLSSIDRNEAKQAVLIEGMFVSGRLNFALSSAASVVIQSATSVMVEPLDSTQSRRTYQVLNGGWYEASGDGQFSRLTGSQFTVSKVVIESIESRLPGRKRLVISYLLQDEAFSVSVHVPDL